MITQELKDFIDRYHQATAAFITGDPESQKPLWSQADDITLANPISPVARGWDAVSRVFDNAAAVLRDGTQFHAERVTAFATDDLAYTVEVEHSNVRIGEAPAPADVSLRVTTVFRREEDGWKIVHRHADTITAPRSPESLLTQ